MFALCGFAIAQPLFGLLGDNPTFFVAHDVDAGGLVGFALALLLIPPLVFFGVLLIARAVSPVVASISRAVIVGLLVAVTLLPPLDRVLDPSPTVWIVVGIVVAAIGGLAYRRFSTTRTFLLYLTPAPILFLVLFLFVSPAHVLISGDDPAAAAGLQGVQPPVVVVVFDELPLGALLDDQGEIDAARYPGFARLAGMASWYDQATTVALQTHAAVPAIQSGQFPVEMPLPVAANYPESLFTFLARSHHFHTFETLTRLCPKKSCRHIETKTADPHFISDVETVYWHTLLGDDLAAEWGVPPISDRWSGFGEELTTEPLPTPEDDDGLTIDEQLKLLVNQDRIGEFEAFLASLGTGRDPGVWFIHSLLPHNPYQWLPDGLRYTGGIPGLGSDLTWPQELELVEIGAQRMVLQAKVVDQLVDRMLDRLDATGVLDDAIVVVTADHGAVFQPGENFRALSGVNNTNKDEVLPVPLFVKYPKQAGGEVDHRSARTFDVLPTIVDALGADVPKGWDFDGRSLLASPKERPYRIVRDAEQIDTVDGPVDATVLQRRLERMLGASGGPHDGYRVGPYGNLVGKTAAELAHGSPTGSVRVYDAEEYDDVRFDTPIPALFEGGINGVEPGQWIAVALNGTIAGVGTVYRLDGTRVIAMLDPSLMVAGANRIDAYEIVGLGTLRPLEVNR